MNEMPRQPFESLATPTTDREKSVLTNQEKVLSSLAYNLGGAAQTTWMAMNATGTSLESFSRWVEDFNATTPTERGAGQYDHSRTLDENVDITEEVTVGSGYVLHITLRKSGEISLATHVLQ